MSDWSNVRKWLRQNPVKGQLGLIFVNCLHVPQFEITPLFVKINNWQFLRHNTWVGGFKRPRPGLTSNHRFHESGFISATTNATFRTTNHGLKYKHLHFGIWEAVKFEFRPIGIVRKLGGGSAKTMDEVVVTIQSHTPFGSAEVTQTQSTVILASHRHSVSTLAREQHYNLVQSASCRLCHTEQVLTFFVRELPF
jgi:hypothetical protein